MTATQAEVLRALGDGEAYGLELVRDTDGQLRRGGVYVMLGRLRDKGFVRSRQQPRQPGERGPTRVLYRRTPTGARALGLWDELVELEETR